MINSENLSSKEMLKEYKRIRKAHRRLVLSVWLSVRVWAQIVFVPLGTFIGLLMLNSDHQLTLFGAIFGTVMVSLVIYIPYFFAVPPQNWVRVGKRHAKIIKAADSEHLRAACARAWEREGVDSKGLRMEDLLSTTSFVKYELERDILRAQKSGQ